MASIEEKQRLMAKLLGMANQQINEINASNRYGGSDGDKLAMSGISNREFMEAVKNVDKFPSAGLHTTRPPSDPNSPMPPLGPGIGFSSDATVVLQSIDNTLRDIYTLLMEITGRGGPAQKIEPTPEQ